MATLEMIHLMVRGNTINDVVEKMKSALRYACREYDHLKNDEFVPYEKKFDFYSDLCEKEMRRTFKRFKGDRTNLVEFFHLSEALSNIYVKNQRLLLRCLEDYEKRSIRKRSLTKSSLGTIRNSCCGCFW